MRDLELMALTRRVDRLLTPWDRDDGPGMVVGVVQGGALVLHRQVGMASLDLGVKLGPDSVFRIASVSKQFTCAVILLLAAEGRLNVQDDVHKYVPELPDYGHRLTLAHLMHNTSGLRDMLELMRLGGADLSFACTSEDLLAAICRQRSLNFVPGTRYLYSNSSFMLLGLIAERVTGRSLPDLLEDMIFAPLGMTRTAMVPNTADIVPGLATGYQPRPGGGWVRAVHGFPLGGEGGLVSCVEDLALWVCNMATGRVGGAKLVEDLETQLPFENGVQNAYARGLQIRHRRGMHMVEHGGSWPGYRTHFLRVPALDVAVICISNDASADPATLAQLALQAAVEDRPGVLPMPDLPPEDERARWPGRYLDRNSGATVDVSLSDDGVPMATIYGNVVRLHVGPDGRLEAAHVAPDFFATLSDDAGNLEVELDAGATATYQRIAPGATLPADLPGVYANDEIAATWTIAETSGETGTMTVQVAGPHVRSGPWEIEPVEGDVVRIFPPARLYRSWLDVRVQRDSGGKITDLAVNGGRARLLVFARVAGGN
jgi:D-aminopeptidase